MPATVSAKIRLLMILVLAAPGIVRRALCAEPSCCGPVSEQGSRLLSVLDGMNVESLWLAREHVNWETGEPDRGPDYTGPGRSTHCSAFAAAVGKRLGVYMLRPPEHGQVLLANAQAQWFRSPAGRQSGWRPVGDAHEAQSLANRGSLVVVVYESPDPHRPGHIAIVRPAHRPARLLEENGPEIIQAGQRNHTKTSTKVGFLAHPGAWPGGVVFYAHPIAP
ncbi:MAG: hypothetical protein IT167_04890 [Bryobacterales bacterium]|nr:hypothetical protein [Bryobacterales bacterium]